MDNYVGKRLDGRYEIRELIGVGGMAVVYKAYDSIDDRIVAVKILKDEFLANEEFRRRFKNESKAIAVLSHPNIVKVYDVSFGDRLQYIVMEYIEGITLKEYIEQRGVVDWKEALTFVIQILKALQHAHDKGIVHRDIKPQNIMLLKDGTIKVADFGIARFSRGETRTVTEKAIGSVHYISPEQAKGETTDEKADLYSVGVVLYEMLTGKLPFEADSAVSVALMQLQAEAKPPRELNPSIPIGFEQITLKAMQKSTRDRYQSAAEMLLDLEELRRNPNIKFDYQPHFSEAREQDTGAIAKTQIVPDLSSVLKKDTASLGNIQDTGSVPKNTAEEPKKKKKTKMRAVVIGLVCALVIFAGIIAFLLLKNGGSGFDGLFSAKKIEVDTFIGLNYVKDIKNNSAYKGKYNFEVVYVSSSDREEGIVYDQDPKAGGTINKGGTIKLYVTKSGEAIQIPDVSNTNKLEAYDTLTDLGFVVSLESINDPAIAEGQVVKTDPAAGTSALAGSQITVYYAVSGDTGDVFKMPDLSGKSLSDAKRIISDAGLVLVKTKTQDNSAPQDQVISQSPGKGEYVSKNSSVIITVSTGLTAAETTITLPKVGTVELKVMLDGSIAEKTEVNANGQKFDVKVHGTSDSSVVRVYLNDCLYYAAKVDFTADPAAFSKAKTYSVPTYVNVIGMTEEDAKSALAKAGYTDVAFKYDDSSSKPYGTVISQSPDPGDYSVLATNEAIVIVVSASQATTRAVG